MPITYPYNQYGGVWNLTSQSQAQGAGTWATPPVPHLFSWGLNQYGEIGVGNITYYSSPKQVGSLTTWSVLSGTRQSSFGIKTDGTLWVWGQNNNGQLGLGNTTNYSSPKQVGALTNWSQISNGNYHSLALKTDGTIWAWGQNNYGQLGLSNTTYYSSPKQVGSLTTWLNISAGNYRSFAIKTDGTLWSWGNNSQGQLGLNNTTNYSSPKQIGNLTTWSYVYGGANFTVAIKNDGTFWSWGYNGYGQLGLNNRTNYSSPKQLGALTNWSNVANNNVGSVLSIKKDGTLWGWGYNGFGNLGLGNTNYYSSPKQVGSLTTWSKIAVGTGGVSSYGILSNGTLYAWGSNGFGQLGIGNITNYSSPKQIGNLTTWLNIASGYGTPLAIAKT